VATLKDKYELSKLASELRGRLGEDDRSPVDVFRLAHTIEELTLVFYPMGERISGMCLKGVQDVLIAVNSSMTYGRQRFSFAHELYHFFYDNMTTVICAQDIGAASDVERDANMFASFFLAPPASLSEQIKAIKAEHGMLDLPDVIRLEQFFGVSRQAMLFRLMEEGELPRQDAEAMRSQIISRALELGYDDALYRPWPESKARMTYGRYIKQAEELLRRGLISDGKFEELLLEAFRADLVYGLDEGGELVD
jgi:Zn-dependent peptidase ImmA (M78 family)